METIKPCIQSKTFTMKRFILPAMLLLAVMGASAQEPAKKTKPVKKAPPKVEVAKFTPPKVEEEVKVAPPPPPPKVKKPKAKIAPPPPPPKVEKVKVKKAAAKVVEK
jgi:hypothetical protein